MEKFAAVVVGAGYGQLQRGFPKVLERFNGRMLVEHQLAAAKSLDLSPVVVVLNPKFEGELIEKQLKEAGHKDLVYAWQDDRRGPADAVFQALPELKKHGVSDVVGLLADMPNVSPKHIRDLTIWHHRSMADLTISSWAFEPDHPMAGMMDGYAYFDRRSYIDGLPALPAVRQYEGMPKPGSRVLSSVYVMRLSWFEEVFHELPFEGKGDEFAQERHLTRLVEAGPLGHQITHMTGLDPIEIVGVDTQADLAALAGMATQQINGEGGRP